MKPKSALDQVIGAPSKGALQQALAGDAADGPDATGEQETVLSTDDEARFRKWLVNAGKSRNLRVKNLRGFWQVTGGDVPVDKAIPDVGDGDGEDKAPAQVPGGRWIDLGKGSWRFEKHLDNPEAEPPRKVNYSKLKDSAADPVD